MGEIVVGAYYELPDGQIAYVYGYNSVENKVRYHFDGNSQKHIAMSSELDTWKHREDLRDFPNATNPRLPYEFDLMWDIKYMSDLEYQLSGEGTLWGEELEALKEAVVRHKIANKIMHRTSR